jgi:hypothetical protein
MCQSRLYANSCSTFVQPLFETANIVCPGDGGAGARLHATTTMAGRQCARQLHRLTAANMSAHRHTCAKIGMVEGWTNIGSAGSGHAR